MKEYAPRRDGSGDLLISSSEIVYDPFSAPIIMNHTGKSSIKEETSGRAERPGRNKGEWRTAYSESPHKVKAIAELNSLNQKRPVNAYQLKDGRVLELRIGSEKDAENILTRDHKNYSIYGSENPDVRIVSFSDSPSDPIGFYIITSYFENDKYWLKDEHDGQKMVGEQRLIYVSPKHRGQHLGSILTMSSVLESLDDSAIDTLKFEVANERIGNVLQRLGYMPAGKTSYGYDEYKIDLQGRKNAVREVFQQQLNQHLQAVPATK